MVIKCKGFDLVVIGNKTYIKTRLQTQRLVGSSPAIKRIAHTVNETTTLTDLVSFFYNRDYEGNAQEQIISTVTATIREEQPQ